MKYTDIIFLQDSNAEEALQILKTKGEKAAMEYLQQWDYRKTPIVDSPDPWGDKDHLYKKDNYVLSYNLAVGYLGLIEVFD